MSKLKRRISSVFGGKKADPTVSGLAPLREDAEDETAFPAYFREAALDDHHLLQATVDSLHERSRTLEQELNLKSTENSRLDGQLCARTEELRGLQRNVRRLEHDSARVRHLQVEIENAGQEKRTAEEQHAQKVAELQERLKEYQVWSVKMSEAHAQVQERVDTLESQNHTLLQSTDRPIAELHQDKVALEKRVKMLGAELTHGRAEHQGDKRAVAALQNSKILADGRIKELTDRLALCGQENEAIKSDSVQKLDRMRRFLEELQQRHNVEKEEASRVLGHDLTPRIVLVHKMFSRGFQTTTVDDRPNTSSFLQSCSPAMLTNQLLDIRLSAEQVQRLARNIAADELVVIACDLCQLPKFAPKPGVRSRLRVNEFARPSQLTSCCTKSICKECYLKALTKSLATDWWTNLDIENWLLCPMPSCGKPLPISHRAALENLLRQLNDRDKENNLAMYDRIITFRTALKRQSPRPSDDALRIACALHAQLTSAGRMYSLFEPSFSNTQPDETGRIPTFNPGKLWMVSVDHDGGSINVPLFVRFLRRRRTAKECTICTDEIFDIDFGSVKEWIDSCAGFQGHWMWNVLLFPVKLGLECSHEIDFCNGCLEKHLKSMLEQYGRSRCDQLACPSAGCGRRLAYDEIQLYAKQRTFEKYDRYLKLNALSQFPNFRWCLRRGCSNGQLYDDDGPFDPHIRCEECGFEMCYQHSTPWHEGRTCQQVDSMRAHGDPEFQQTQDWIARNTKPCPSCRENIQKGEDCFHMTCSSCNSEFCWECLADWSLISPGPGRYNQNAHRRGCHFRTNAVKPTQVSGTNLQEALRGR